MSGLSLVERPAPWWESAPSPECVSWCEDSHVGDFQQHSGQTCCKTVLQVAGIEVLVMSWVGAQEVHLPGILATEPAVVSAHFGGEELTPDQARMLGLALLEAAQVADRTPPRL